MGDPAMLAEEEIQGITEIFINWTEMINDILQQVITGEEMRTGLHEKGTVTGITKNAVKNFTGITITENTTTGNANGNIIAGI